MVDAVTAYQSWSVLEDNWPKIGVASARALAVAMVPLDSVSYLEVPLAVATLRLYCPES